MIEFFDFLSGSVPGGILVLLFLIVALNIFFQLIKASGIISAQQSKKQQITFSAGLVFIYITLWFALRPLLPPQRIVVLPSRDQHGEIQLDDNAFNIPEMVQRYAYNNLNEKYLLHRWEWLLETIGRDSVKSYSAWIRTARRLGASYIIESRFKDRDSAYEIIVNRVDSYSSTDRMPSGSMGLNQVIDALNQGLDIFPERKALPVLPEQNYIKAKALYYLDQYENSLELVETAEDNDCRVLTAAIYMQKGLQIKYDRVKHEFIKFENPEFKKSKKILNDIVHKHKDWPGVAYILGKIALREADYLKSDTYLKKAFIDDPSDCRVHLALSYLLPDRLNPIGYQNRIEILNRAVFLDPGFSAAVYELAKAYFESGTGTPSGAGTTMAINTMEKFFRIKNDEPRILGLLASVYLRISRIDDAHMLFEKLMKMFPDDSDNYYNIGIVYFQKKEFTKALDYFLKAIDIDQNLDSYLYAGVIYREIGNMEKALEYFRERVKRMTGEDDQYAREAMQGIRTVLEEMKSDSVNAN